MQEVDGDVADTLDIVRHVDVGWDALGVGFVDVEFREPGQEARDVPLVVVEVVLKGDDLLLFAEVVFHESPVCGAHYILAFLQSLDRDLPKLGESEVRSHEKAGVEDVGAFALHGLDRDDDLRKLDQQRAEGEKDDGRQKVHHGVRHGRMTSKEFAFEGVAGIEGVEELQRQRSVADLDEEAGCAEDDGEEIDDRVDDGDTVRGP